MPTVLITGGHTGLGLEAATQLAAGPKLNLVLAGRNSDTIEIAANQLRSSYGVEVTALKLDLSSLCSVRAAAENCRALLQSGAIDGLQAIVCNAGQFQNRICWSVDGFEENFASNYLGHFVLVNLLLDCVSDHGRIVFTVSSTHDPETMDGKIVGKPVEPDARTLAFQGRNGAKPISGGKRYSTSKLCMVLFAYELDRRLRRSGSSIASISFDPGLIPETGFGKALPGPVRWLTRTAPVKTIFRMMGTTMGSLSFSGAALARIAADPAFAGGSGKYFQSSNGSLIEARSSKGSHDQQRAIKLWSDSEQLVHLQPSENPAALKSAISAP